MSRFKRFIFFVTPLVLFVACGEDYDAPLVYVDDTGGKQYKLYDLYRDAYGNEGIIAYVESYDDFRYIMALSLDETIASWGPMGETIFKGDNDSSVFYPQFGLAMLQCMISRGIHHFPAQKWCYERNQDEKYPRTGSWRMPSYVDIYLMLKGDYASDIDSLNQYLVQYGGTPLTKTDYDYYWCCEEDYEDYAVMTGIEQNFDPDNRAVMITMGFRGGADKDFWIKKSKHRVRAVKVIYYVAM